MIRGYVPMPTLTEAIVTAEEWGRSLEAAMLLGAVVGAVAGWVFYRLFYRRGRR